MQPEKKEITTKWISVYYPVVGFSGRDLIIPAETDLLLEGKIDAYDPERHSDEIIVNIKPGEIRSITFIADKKGYR